MRQRKLTYEDHKKIGAQKRLHGDRTYEQQQAVKPPKPKTSDKPKSDLTEILHCCGHTVGHNLKRHPPADRSGIRNRIAGELCMNCQKALEKERQRALTGQLPPLTGTRDERFDGERVRTRIVPMLREEIRQQIISYQIAVQAGTMSSVRAERMEALLLRTERALLRQPSGKWWLSLALKEPRSIIAFGLKRTIESDKKQAHV